MKRGVMAAVWLAAAVANGCVVEASGVGKDVANAEQLPVVAPVAATPSLHNYEDAPRTPDADDPAIWVPSSPAHEALVIGVLKDGGLQVYDLAGQVVQSVSPPSRRELRATDPTAPGEQPEAGTCACEGSESGETFGRFNNVDLAYGFPLVQADGTVRKVDLAVVTDRGCDRLRFYAIDPTWPGGPLVDVTAGDVPRVFPERLVQPSPWQSPGAVVRVETNPVDDQNTAYGIAVYVSGRDDADDDDDDDRDDDDDCGDDKPGHDAARFRAAVTQRSRSAVGLVELHATGDGRVSYAPHAELRFDTIFAVPDPADEDETIAWTACRENAEDDLQLEGLVVDHRRDVLYATQEIIGLWEIPLTEALVGVTHVSPEHLVETVQSFGLPVWAVPDGDELSCEDEAPDAPLPAGTVIIPGNPAAGGEHLVADVEGLTIYYSPEDDERAYLLVSSQGSDSVYAYDLDEDADDDERLAERFLGGFHAEGVHGTDGLDVTSRDLGGPFTGGLLVMQNGAAPPPASEDPIGGFEYDGSTQFVYVRWTDVAASFDPPLE